MDAPGKIELGTERARPIGRCRCMHLRWSLLCAGLMSLIVDSPLASDPKMIPVFTLLREPILKNIASEMDRANFKRVWGHTPNEMAEQLLRLSVITDPAKFAEAKTIDFPMEYVLRPDVSAFAESPRQGSNHVVLYGGMVLANYLIATATAYDRYNRNLRFKLRDATVSEPFSAEIAEILKSNWTIKSDAPGSSFVRFLSGEYAALVEEKARGQGYSIGALHGADLMTLMLFVYAHEFAHVLLGHLKLTPKDHLAEEIEADRMAARLLFARIEGGWKVGSGTSKAPTTIWPVLVWYLVMMKSFEGTTEGRQLQDRYLAFITYYLWLEVFMRDAVLRRAPWTKSP